MTFILTVLNPCYFVIKQSVGLGVHDICGFIVVVIFAVFRVFGLLFGVCSEKIKFLLSPLKNYLFAFVIRFFAAISR